MEENAVRNVSQETRPSTVARTETKHLRVPGARDVGNVHWFQVRQSDAERNNKGISNWHVDHIFGLKLNHGGRT